MKNPLLHERPFLVNWDSHGSYCSVAMGGPHVLLIDEEDFETLGHLRWFVFVMRPQCIYAARSIYDRGTKKSDIELLHRKLLSPLGRLTVDHRDGNGLNNRRYNIRVATYQENCSHRVSPRTGKSGYRGVYPTASGRYMALICIKYKIRSLGTFNTAEDAARAWDTAALTERGTFTYLNFPDSNAVTPS